MSWHIMPRVWVPKFIGTALNVMMLFQVRLLKVLAWWQYHCQWGMRNAVCFAWFKSSLENSSNSHNVLWTHMYQWGFPLSFKECWWSPCKALMTNICLSLGLCKETVKGSNSRLCNVSHLTTLVPELFTSVIQWWAPSPFSKYYMIWCGRYLWGHIKAIRPQSSLYGVCKGQSLCGLYYCAMLSILWPLYIAFHYVIHTISSKVARSVMYTLEIFNRTAYGNISTFIQSLDIVHFQNMLLKVKNLAWIHLPNWQFYLSGALQQWNISTCAWCSINKYVNKNIPDRLNHI